MLRLGAVSRLSPMTVSAGSLLRSVGLDPRGPVSRGTPPASRSAGAYVIESATAFERAPIDLEAVRAWIGRVPTLRLDGGRPTAEDLGQRLAEFWIPGETVVYVGLAGTDLHSRVGGFYRTPLGNRRPHAGGHWLKTLRGLESFLVWWATSDQPAQAERDLLDAFAVHAAPHATGLAARLALPFANRQSADGVRKPHGVTGSTMTAPGTGPATAHALSMRVTTPGMEPAGRRRDQLAAINAALQAAACSAPDGRISAIDGARELDRRGLLRDSRTRPGLPLRNLLRAGRIERAYREPSRRRVIGCGSR